MKFLTKYFYARKFSILNSSWHTNIISSFPPSHKTPSLQPQKSPHKQNGAAKAISMAKNFSRLKADTAFHNPLTSPNVSSPYHSHAWITANERKQCQYRNILSGWASNYDKLSAPIFLSVSFFILFAAFNLIYFSVYHNLFAGSVTQCFC